MKLKRYLLTTATSALILFSTNSLAGREGISLYYGLGAGAAAPQDMSVPADLTGLLGANIEFDPTANIELILGVEEDGWAFEAIASQSADVGTSLNGMDYNLQAVELGIGYRTIERNDRYYKFKYSQTDADFEFSGGGTTATAETEGNSFTVGMGFRMERDERMEVDFTYHDNDDTQEAIYFINMRYLWGGSKYQGKTL